MAGFILQGRDREIVELMHKYGSIRWSDEPFILKSGRESHIYFSGREDFSDNPELLYFVGLKMATVAWQYTNQFDKKQPCLVGIPTAGTPLAIAASMASYHGDMTREGVAICFRVMKEEKKEHGLHYTWINGEPCPEKHTYWLVDNVATSGGTFITAAEKLKESGYPPIQEISCLVLLDRQEGGVKKMEEMGFKQVVAVYKFLDIVSTFGELGLWPKDRVEAVEELILRQLGVH